MPLLTDAFYGRSHKGFQPLRTDDVDALDELTEDSEDEDTVYNRSTSQSLSHKAPKTLSNGKNRSLATA
uniref:Uncharacterized protein n=1 Tax=Romanomermis culicivorax TaxID=13658 RepID=A0A915HGR7_ROMCU